MLERRDVFRQKVESLTRQVSNVISKVPTYAQRLRKDIFSTEGLYVASLTAVITSYIATYVEIVANKDMTGTALLAFTMTNLALFPYLSVERNLARHGKHIFPL